MIWGQIVWGAFLAGILGLNFHRAWRWEHSPEKHVSFAEKYGKETFIMVPPTDFFWILLALLIWFVFRDGFLDGLVRYAALAMGELLLLSVYYVLMLILMPFLRNRFSARACAVLWLVPVFVFWQGYVLVKVLPLTYQTIYLPRHVLLIIATIWLAGFLAVGGYYLISHMFFRNLILKHSTKEPNEETWEILKREQEAMDYRKPIGLLRADVSAPFSMGQTNKSRCMVLPNRHYTPEELSMIFNHELHHLQRCDVDTKAFLCLCNAFCWFNPLVWIATRKAAEDLERSCDEIVTEKMTETERRSYATLLLDSAAPGHGFTTCLSAEASTLHYRLKSIMDPQRHRLGIPVLMAALFCCVISFGHVSLSDEKGSFTSLFLTPDVKIQAIYDKQYTTGLKWDEEVLRKELDKINLEHIAEQRNPVVENAQIIFRLSGIRTVYLLEKHVVIRDFYHYNNVSIECYLVKSAIDWNALNACITR